MRKDLIGSIALLGIAAAYYAASTTIFSSALADEVGADGIPVLLAALLAVIALAIGVQAFVRVPAPAKPASTEGEAEAPVLRALGLLGFGVLYIMVVQILGYFPTIALLIGAVALYEGMRLSWRLVAVALGGAAFFWLLFVMVLGIRQPAGLFF